MASWEAQLIFGINSKTKPWRLPGRELANAGRTDEANTHHGYYHAHDEHGLFTRQQPPCRQTTTPLLSNNNLPVVERNRDCCEATIINRYNIITGNKIERKNYKEKTRIDPFRFASR